MVERGYLSAPPPITALGGGPDVSRTHDLYLARVLLSQLSYGPKIPIRVYIKTAVSQLLQLTIVYLHGHE